MKLILKSKMKTHNELKRMWSNPRPHVGRALYRAYRDLLKIAIRDQLPKSYAAVQVKRTVVVVYFTKRLQDKDNFMASLKPLLDTLVELDLIRDDSPKWIKLIAEQEIDSGKAYRADIEIT